MLNGIYKKLGEA